MTAPSKGTGCRLEAQCGATSNTPWAVRMWTRHLRSLSVVTVTSLKTHDAASPPVVVDDWQQQLVPQVWQRAADDAGVVAKQEAADAGKQRQHPHGARLI
jgi:hypothetical protein